MTGDIEFCAFLKLPELFRDHSICYQFQNFEVFSARVTLARKLIYNTEVEKHSLATNRKALLMMSRMLFLY